MNAGSFAPALVMFVWPWVARKWARTLESARHQAENFAIRNAGCTHEEDRPVLEGNIVDLMDEGHWPNTCLGALPIWSM